MLFLAGTTVAQHPNTILKKQIDSLLNVDQLVQQNMIVAYQKNATKLEMDNLEKVKIETFNRHIPLLKNIVSTYGLPTYSLVGEKSSDNFLVMVNHSFTDSDFQRRVITLAKKEVKRKNISGQQIALLTDKMLIKTGEKQLYGSQCDYDSEGNAIAKNVADLKNVDKRRKEMGLNPLKEYLAFMTDLHQQMNKKNE
jgi:hypothetical protein